MLPAYLSPLGSDLLLHSLSHFLHVLVPLYLLVLCPFSYPYHEDLRLHPSQPAPTVPHSVVVTSRPCSPLPSTSCSRPGHGGSVDRSTRRPLPSMCRLLFCMLKKKSQKLLKNAWIIAMFSKQVLNEHISESPVREILGLE